MAKRGKQDVCASLAVQRDENAKQTDTETNFCRPWITLHEAAENGDVSYLALLLKNGTPVNQSDRYGMIALHYAARSGNVEMLKFLVQNGAAVNDRDDGGMTALHHAVESGKTGIVQYLIQNGARVNRPDNDGRIALYEAAMYEKSEIVQYLVQNGATVNDRNDINKKALQYAVDEKTAGIQKRLLKFNTHLNTDSSCDDGRNFKHRLSDVQNAEAISDPISKKKYGAEWSINPHDVEFDVNKNTLEGGIFATIHFGKWMRAPVAMKKNGLKQSQLAVPSISEHVVSS